VNAEPLLVLTTCENPEQAERLARLLVEARLAACVNAVQGVTSIYRWQSTVEQATESLLVIKTTGERYKALEDAIRRESSYELPEVVAVRIERGLEGYLDWIDEETRAERP
jgi:periplasmic divalent cation tolerance protein